MSYANFKAVVKKVNLKPKGIQEIVLEVSGDELRGQLERLSRMVDNQAQVELESMIINYNFLVDASTNKPLISYKVDERGVVMEVKKEDEQLEADLGLPPEKIETKEERKEVEIEVIDEFILSGLSPTYDDLPFDFESIVKRKLEGESYSKIATELGMSSGKIVDVIDEYRKRVAPLAEKWDEWRKENGQPEVKSEESGDQKGDPKADSKEDDAA